MIIARNLSAQYKEPVITGLNLELAPDLIHGLIGPNGSGKTTLMRVLAGQLPHGGELSVFGTDPFDNESAMDRIVFSGADMVFPINWKAKKIFALGAKRWQTYDLDHALALLDRFEASADTPFGKLSLGQKSAVAVVFALAARCPFTLLDEPYLGIDAQRRELLYRILLDEQEEQPRTILLSTHHINESARVLDSVHLISEGQVQLSSDVETLTNQILEVTGPAETLASWNVPVLARETVGGTTKFIIDTRVGINVPTDPHVRVSAVDLETAVLALQEALR